MTRDCWMISNVRVRFISLRDSGCALCGFTWFLMLVCNGHEHIVWRYVAIIINDSSLSIISRPQRAVVS
jgi:hypothetical protein